MFIPISAGRSNTFFSKFIIGQQTISIKLENPHLPLEAECLKPCCTSCILIGQSVNFLQMPILPSSNVHRLPSNRNKKKQEIQKIIFILFLVTFKMLI